MTRGIFRLMASRRFLPLFITQFLGAFNDNFLKNAIAMFDGIARAIHPSGESALTY